MLRLKLNHVSKRGHWYHVFNSEICGQVMQYSFVNPPPSVDRIVSALYPQQYLPNLFHIYTFYHATSEGVLHVKFFFKLKIWIFCKFFKFVTLTLSCFDLGSNMNWSIVWVIMGRWGYPQNAGVLVVLVLTGSIFSRMFTIDIDHHGRAFVCLYSTFGWDTIVYSSWNRYRDVIMRGWHLKLTAPQLFA